MGSNDHFVDILYVYSSVYNRIGIPIHTTPAPVLPCTNVFSFDLYSSVILSSLLFVVVMNLVPSEARSGIHSELLYADDLVLMASTMEPLGRRITEEHKEQNVNAGKYKFNLVQYLL